jgi:type IV fimbrial biogenesis protein FimT
MKNAHGWTLLELLITLAIFSLLVSIGLPSFTESIARNTEKVALKSLQHLNYYARTEAIRRNNYYTLCPSDDLVHCHGTWNKQLIVFSDENKNEQVDGTDVLYRVFQFNDQTPCIEWNRPSRQYVQFKSSGASNGTAGHFKFCDPVNSSNEYRIVVSLNGRISLRKQ